LRASALPLAPAVQARCLSRGSARRCAGPLPAVLAILTFATLAAASPAAGTTRLPPIRPVHRRLFTARSSRRRFKLFVAAETPPPPTSQGPTVSPVPPATGPAGRPARPGAEVGVGVQLPDGPVRLTRRVGHDLRDLVASPFRVRARGWETLAGGALLVGLAHAADDDVRTAVRREGSESRSWAHTLRPLGQEGGFALAALAWGAGTATGHPRLAATGEDSLEAGIVAAGFVTPLLKVAVGRDRPRSSRGDDSLSGNGQSFPSGEVTEAFAMASVIAAHSHRPWVDALAWGTAGAVAWERLRLDAHWVSDVTAGALIGAGIGHWIVRRNRPRLIDERPRVRSSFWQGATVTPLVADGRYSLGFRVSF